MAFTGRGGLLTMRLVVLAERLALANAQGLEITTGVLTQWCMMFSMPEL